MKKSKNRVIFIRKIKKEKRIFQIKIIKFKKMFSISKKCKN